MGVDPGHFHRSEEAILKGSLRGDDHGRSSSLIGPSFRPSISQRVNQKPTDFDILKIAPWNR